MNIEDFSGKCILCNLPFQHRKRYWGCSNGLKEVEFILGHVDCRILLNKRSKLREELILLKGEKREIENKIKKHMEEMKNVEIDIYLKSCLNPLDIEVLE